MGKYTVFYDEYCPFCNFSVRLLRRFDVLHRMIFQGMVEYSKKNRISVDDMMNSGIQVQTPDGKKYFRMRAIALITLRSPPLFLLSLAADFLIIAGLGESFYELVASRRYSIPIPGNHVLRKH
ncbi:MAG: DUF393 domain-containing protein [Thermoplasmataceae archaeon]|jgi:predicted DCC family thiol-disulfide oxidoreductase YuxK